MKKSSIPADPQKKYWWLLLVVLPIVLAFITILPDLLKKESVSEAQKNSLPSKEQKADNIEQTTGEGHNFTNVQGNITITEANEKK